MTQFLKEAFDDVVDKRGHDRDINAAINIVNIANGKGVSHDSSNGKTLQDTP